jgi:hypothetical protein
MWTTFSATTNIAPGWLIQHERVTTSACSQCRIHMSLYPSSQQSGANRRLLGQCDDNILLAKSHHAVQELVSPGEECPTTLQKLHWFLSRRTNLSAIVSVAHLALQACCLCKIASPYHLAYGQSIVQTSREVYCLNVIPAQWLIHLYRVWAQQLSMSVAHCTSRWALQAEPIVILSSIHIAIRTGKVCRLIILIPDFAAIDIYWLSTAEWVPALMKSCIIHIFSIDWIIQLVSSQWSLWMW